MENYYGRPKNEIISYRENSPMVFCELVDYILFGGISDRALSKKGLDPKEVKRWTMDIANGIIPEGVSPKEFEAKVLSRLNSTRINPR